MKKLILAIVLVFFATGVAYAQDAWYEAAEASCVDYEVAGTTYIPAAENLELALDDITNVETPGNSNDPGKPIIATSQPTAATGVMLPIFVPSRPTMSQLVNLANLRHGTPANQTAYENAIKNLCEESMIMLRAIEENPPSNGNGNNGNGQGQGSGNNNGNGNGNGNNGRGNN